MFSKLRELTRKKTSKSPKLSSLLYDNKDKNFNEFKALDALVFKADLAK
jgi:hypothetical protein